MQNFTFAKKTKYLPSTSQSGFTMIEILVVVILIGVLSAIAAPSWLTFVNRQRVGSANERVLGVIKKAQSEAKTKKRKYNISIRTTTISGKSTPQITFHPSLTALADVPDAQWENLGEPGQILLGTNITTENNGSTTTAFSNSLSAKTLISFDYTGKLPSNPTPDVSNKLIIAVGIPVTSTSVGIKRCVMISTLLGTASTEEGAYNSTTKRGCP
jgi:prepilin-type N-terminal cleavage/methylation domain-containing protein